ncbi:PREDICTED: uncharacterized protein LOC109235562 [Nicotiana attenuata]|uniref:uncharacterized protein LOC109235562 n=1 Tax=Nicotiana attenuata TaxID=49451 RepID=UPI000905A0A3|nr:PREDICTED: uncharacterized protein LOC109235562 [Nicotiana attenuata]
MTGRGKGRNGTGRGCGHFQGRGNAGAMSQPQVQPIGNTAASPETGESNNPSQEPLEIGQISSNTWQRPSIETVSSRNLDRSVLPSPEVENENGADDIDRAVGLGARDIVNYCGLIMRSTISFRDGNWQKIVSKHGESMWLKVKDKLEVLGGVREHRFQAFVIDTMRRLFRAWKARLSIRYSRHVAEGNILSRRPEEVELEDWKYLVEYFGSPEFKVVSERNRKNREKQITKHACGTRSFAEVEESTKNLATGEKEPPDRVWEIQHTRKNDRGETVWVDPQSQQIHCQLQELVAQQQSKEIEHPMTRDKILSSVLGERTGYIHGKGYGKKPPKNIHTQVANIEASMSSAIEIVRQEMQVDMDRKLQEEREQMAAELKRNMEQELQRKFDEKLEHVNLEVENRVSLEVAKKIQEQLGALMTRMQEGQGSETMETTKEGLQGT